MGLSVRCTWLDIALPTPSELFSRLYLVRGLRSEIASATSVISNNVIYCYTVLCHMLNVSCLYEKSKI